jgi:hypothetical protein
MRIRPLLAAVALSAIVAGVARADDDDDIPLDKLPAPVRATLLAEARGATLHEIEREEDDGKVHYEACALIDGKCYELKVAADGTLLSRKIEDDHDHKDHEHAAATKPAK